MRKVTTTITTTVAAPRGPFYQWLVPGVFDTELDTVMRDEAGFAGITVTTGTTGPWDVPGSTRIVHQYDGTFSRETVLAANAPDYFDYRLTEFSSFFLRLLMQEARGQWWFTDAGNGTHTKWTYTAEARSILTVPILIPVMKVFFNRLMRATLARIKARAEAEVKGDAQ
ncbi:MAG: SRPBCC family protein [Candidatus Tectomicrobia bacterium]|nr:SRPBCC family protein [Candidatus Tectomicrobia bacterium]